MLKTGILSPCINSLLSRIRHTNTIVIADRGFPFGRKLKRSTFRWWTTSQGRSRYCAIQANFVIGRIISGVLRGHREYPITRESHLELKTRVPHTIGLIRTGDSTLTICQFDPRIGIGL